MEETPVARPKLRGRRDGAARAAKATGDAALALTAPRRAPAASATVASAASAIPPELLNDPALQKAMSVLPANYEFEIPKTIWRIRRAKATCVALQFPEGLLMYSMVISDIIQQFTGASTVIMGDVTYGACCVDDFTARALGCDFLVHYAHSCLVPVDVSQMNMLYVFVDIRIDTQHFVATVRHNFAAGTRLFIAGTIQFGSAMQEAKQLLIKSGEYPSVALAHSKPLSPGEILGCTSPKLDASGCDAVVFLADGRFHLESLMIHNPALSFYKYDPYSKLLTKEGYDHAQMHDLRRAAIQQASKARKWGLILGTLGRQGNPRILARLEQLLAERGMPYTVVFLSEILPTKLQLFADVDAWVQVACPRLSIDWGYAFAAPLLNPYEAEVALNESPWLPVYPMDTYAAGGGRWSNYHEGNKQSTASQRTRPGAVASAPSASETARSDVRAEVTAVGAGPDARDLMPASPDGGTCCGDSSDACQPQGDGTACAPRGECCAASAGESGVAASTCCGERSGACGAARPAEAGAEAESVVADSVASGDT